MGAVAICRILIAAGCDLRCRNAQCFRPLLLAAETNQLHTFAAVAAACRASGDLGDVAADKGNGYTVLHFAAINNNVGLLVAALKFDAYRVPDIIDARSSYETTGADNAVSADAVNVMAQTALHKAVLYDFRDCVSVLLDAGANPDIADNKGRGPLHSAVTRNNVALTKLLLKHRADPNLRDAARETIMEKDAKNEGFRGATRRPFRRRPGCIS